jgi:hypothetical protein
VTYRAVNYFIERHADRRFGYHKKIDPKATSLLSFLPIEKAPMQPPVPLSKLHKPRDFLRAVRLSTTRNRF